MLDFYFRWFSQLCRIPQEDSSTSSASTSLWRKWQIELLNMLEWNQSRTCSDWTERALALSFKVSMFDSVAGMAVNGTCRCCSEYLGHQSSGRSSQLKNGAADDTNASVPLPVGDSNSNGIIYCIWYDMIWYDMIWYTIHLIHLLISYPGRESA